MKIILLIVPTILLSLVTVGLAEVRTWKAADGRALKAEFVSATETSVTLKRQLDGRKFTLKLEKLSEEDQNFVHQKLNDLALAKEAADKEAYKKRIPRKNKKVLAFAVENMGKKIGNGECWTLVDQAYQEAKAGRPTSDYYIWGDELEFGEDEIFPGDVIQTKPRKKGVNHTALVMEVLGKGKFRVIEQNWSGKKVTTRTADYHKWSKNHHVRFYRPD